MRPLPQFAVIFAALLALSALPAWKLVSKFDVRIKAYEQQKRVDLKRPMLEQLQEKLHQAHQATVSVIPASATTVAGKLLAVNDEILADLQLEGENAAFSLSYFDASGCIHLIAQFPSFACHQNYLRAGSIPSGTEEGVFQLSRFVPPQPPPDPLSRALGNAIRGLDGYSLASYEVKATPSRWAIKTPSGQAQGRSLTGEDYPRRYGAWLWDGEHRFGMVLEVTANMIDARVDRERARFQQGRRFLYFLCVASYLMILAAFARLAQRRLFNRTQRPSSRPQQ